MLTMIVLILIVSHLPAVVSLIWCVKRAEQQGQR